MQANEIAKEFNLKSLLKFAMPTVAMMVLLNLYTMVDGIFVTRFIGTNAASSINIIWPFVNLTMGIGIMLATGGTAVVAKKLGQNREKEALSDFTFLVIVGLIISIIIAVLGIVFLEDIALLLGATPLLLKDSCTYGFYWIVLTPLTILKSIFEYFFVTAGRPKLGLLTSVMGGLTNVVLDYLLIVVFQFGIGGASLASVMSEFLPCVIGLVFYCNKKNAIHFVKPKFNFKVLTKSCSIGASEMITNVSTGITTFLFNIALLKFAGEDGVAAITIIIYVDMLMIGLCLGFTSGVAPVISYNYGSQNRPQIRRLIHYCLKLMGIFSILAFAFIEGAAPALIGIFVDPGTHVYNIGINGLRIYALGFILKGFNTFIAGMFAAFSNGPVSAVLSFLKNLGLLGTGIILLPYAFGLGGVWMAVPIAESITAVIALILFIVFAGRYGYGKKADKSMIQNKKLKN